VKTWLPGRLRPFAFEGIHGQSIYVDPAALLVMVQTAERMPARGVPAEAIVLWNALVARYGG